MSMLTGVPIGVVAAAPSLDDAQIPLPAAVVMIPPLIRRTLQAKGSLT